MQAFNAYFKIIRKRAASLLIYFVVFVGVAILVTSAFTSSAPNSYFLPTKPNITVFNEDGNSPLVQGLKDYLGQNATLVDLPDEKQEIEDALFYGRIAYVLRIPSGFTQSFFDGGGVTVENTAASGSTSGVFMDLLVNKYLDTAALYAKNIPGATEAQIADNTQKDLALSVAVDVQNKTAASGITPYYYYFQYFAYCILAIMIMGVTSVMMSFNEKDLQNRNLSSPLRPKNMNMQLVLGNLVFAGVVWAVLCVIIFALHGKMEFNPGTLLLCVNALVFTLVSLSIGFFAGKFIRNNAVQAAVTNLVSLGLSFISGVFVEQALLGKTVLAVASFNPTYWYVKAIDGIRNLMDYSLQSMLPVIYSMLIQLGFAVALVVIAMVVTKQKRNTQMLMV